MIIYRPHRSTLADAMQEAREFPTMEAMKEHIVRESEKVWGTPMFAVDDIILDEETVADKRNGWKDTRYVCVKRMGNENYMEKYGNPQCIGMCATDYPGKPAEDEDMNKRKLCVEIDGEVVDLTQYIGDAPCGEASIAGGRVINKEPKRTPAEDEED